MDYKEWQRSVQYFPDKGEIEITQRWNISTNQSDGDWRQIYMKLFQNEVGDIVALWVHRQNKNETSLWIPNKIEILKVDPEKKSNPVIKATFTIWKEVAELVFNK